jgi:hypothetical protein
VNMLLFQILVPLTIDGRGSKKAHQVLRRIESELAAKFGGVTAYTQSPAEGLWKRSRTTLCKMLLRRGTRPGGDAVAGSSLGRYDAARRLWFNEAATSSSAGAMIELRDDKVTVHH